MGKNNSHGRGKLDMYDFTKPEVADRIGTVLQILRRYARQTITTTAIARGLTRRRVDEVYGMVWHQQIVGDNLHNLLYKGGKRVGSDLFGRFPGLRKSHRVPKAENVPLDQRLDAIYSDPAPHRRRSMIPTTGRKWNLRARCQTESSCIAHLYPKALGNQNRSLLQNLAIGPIVGEPVICEFAVKADS